MGWPTMGGWRSCSGLSGLAAPVACRGPAVAGLDGYGGLAALCPAVVGVSAACLDAARLYEADSACRLPCPADCRS
jgi:hypothetical protein